MHNLSGYRVVEKLHESSNSLVYRGYRRADKQSVILKMLKQAYPSPEKIAWFKREYETTRSIDLPGVIDVYGWENIANNWVIVLEDFGGESLDRIIAQQEFTIPEFLHLAIEIVRIVGKLHQQQIIHKDINPSNIVLNQQTKQLKLIDFGISTTLSQENPIFRNPNVLEGTLAYISPEQTGRMNRAIDYRTDFYSLGITFYELLTGQLPFPIDDFWELVHCHLAKQPVPPHQLRSEVPSVISDIVFKLIAKNAESRYLSAYDLETDLQECLRQWQSKAEINSFAVGKDPICDRFRISGKLYGRETEIAALLAAFERVSQGAKEMMLVSGYSGIGKSVLVQEVYKPLTRQRGYFIAGKFDQFQRDIPYASLIQAFRSLVRQLLTESEAEIRHWRSRLQAELGENGRVIIEIIPEVELIIGSQPPVSELSPTERKNRFNLVIQKFIKIFTQPEHPLVMFLDDLQWADRASLELIQLLMTTADSQYLFLIGAYRDNEVNEVHPLVQSLEQIEKARVTTINRIFLTPLALTDITQLIADSLFVDAATAQPLTQLIEEKTNGNPFFINEFLKSLHSEGWLYFDYKFRQWQWDLEQIKAQRITDNVLKLAIAKVKKIPAATQELLKLAACVGNQFDLKTLATISEKSIPETATDLRSALQSDLILPLSYGYQLAELDIEGLSEQLVTEYKFAHDRIQQAVYSLILQLDKKAVHLRIGRLLLQNTTSEELGQKLFEIVNQLNQGRELIEGQAERNELAQLNLQTGKKAKASAASQLAFNYLQTGLSQLNTESWLQQHDLTLDLHIEAAEAAYLIADYDEMERLSQVVLHQAQALLDKVKVYEIKIQAYCAQTKFIEAIDIGLEALKLLGVELPQQPNQSDLTRELEQIKSTLAGRQAQDLIDLPTMSDTDKIAAMRIMNYLLSPAYIAMNQLSLIIWCRQVNLSVQYGNSAESAFPYIGYGLILCLSGELEAGYQFGKLALQLLERFQDKTFKARTYAAYKFQLKHWNEPLRDTSSLSMEAYQNGIETGDLEYAASVRFTHAYALYFSGLELIDAKKETDKVIVVTTQTQQEAYLHWTQIYMQAILNLIGEADNPCLLIGEAYDETKMMPVHLENGDRTAMMHAYSHKLTLSYLFGEFQQAVDNADRFEEYAANAGSSFILPTAYLYDILARLALYADASENQKEEILTKIDTKRSQMELWAKQAPMNFLHKFYLIEAERHRVLGNNSEAREYYDRSIALAQEHEYLNEEALAYELAGKFYLVRQNRVARHYLQDAHYTYQRWGAVAKVKDLEARYPQFLAQVAANTLQTSLNPSVTDSGETTSGVLDLNSVLKASQTISGEIVPDRLLEKLMKTVIENGGAQKGFLILEKDGEWKIEAEQAVGSDEVNILQSLPIDSIDDETQIPILPMAIVNYVIRTQESVVLNNAIEAEQFIRDPYIIAVHPKSILCTPLLRQGKLDGILYLENNLATDAFTSDRLEVLKILSSQAAISIENARLYRQLEDYNRNLEFRVKDRTQELSQTLEVLQATQAELMFENELLRSAEQPSNFDYQVGGSLPMDAPTYVVRSADRYLVQSFETRREFCYVLNPRQMGKSSLMVRMIHHLNHEGYSCGAIDLTRIGSENITPEQWYKGLAVELWRGFSLLRKVNLRTWWQEQGDLSPIQRLSQFIEEILLIEVNEQDNTHPKNLIIFIDEIDSLLGLNFPVNDFFALIRSCYNQRSINPEYRRLTFAFFGVATPNDLISDRQRTPFNIGQAIQLEGFKEHEAQPLLRGLTEKVDNPQTLLKEVLAWTNGQPFLTQKLCQLINYDSSVIPVNSEAEWVANLVRTKIIENWESQDEPEHLRTIRDRLFNSQKYNLLRELYQQIWHQGEMVAVNNAEERELLLSGLVIKQQGILKVHNLIYREIFDLG